MAVSRAPSPPLLAPAALAAPLAGCGDDLPGPGGGDAAPDGDLVIEGLSGPVTVDFDEHGVLHARCESEADCFMVEGYSTPPTASSRWTSGAGWAAGGCRAWPGR